WRTPRSRCAPPRARRCASRRRTRRTTSGCGRSATGRTWSTAWTIERPRGARPAHGAGPPESGLTVRPRKRFGQHFLVDRGAVAAIVAAIDPRPVDRLVEIGPGTAALTAPLLARVGSMDAVEIDRDLAADLRQRFGERLRLHQADVLSFDFAALAGDGSTAGDDPA